jgi:hypothetical protein
LFSTCQWSVRRLDLSIVGRGIGMLLRIAWVLAVLLFRGAGVSLEREEAILCAPRRSCPEVCPLLDCAHHVSHSFLQTTGIYVALPPVLSLLHGKLVADSRSIPMIRVTARPMQEGGLISDGSLPQQQLHRCQLTLVCRARHLHPLLTHVRCHLLPLRRRAELAGSLCTSSLPTKAKAQINMLYTTPPHHSSLAVATSSQTTHASTLPASTCSLRQVASATNRTMRATRSTFAKSPGITNEDTLITAVIAYRQHARNAVDIAGGIVPLTPYCTKVRRNEELVGIVNEQCHERTGEARAREYVCMLC